MTGHRETRPAGGIAGPVLAWYDRHRRSLPWRAPAGAVADPYRVWLSEIMLQQTTVAAVGPYFEAFAGRWPTVADLAAAELDEVLRLWAGLGYYARARNLHRCARMVVEDHGGVFPGTEEELRRLPGIGLYTAAAIVAIAFDSRATPVDANVERIMARLFAVDTPLPRARTALRAHAAALTPDARCGDHAQALMDLGATVCTPRGPRCGACPLEDRCLARRHGLAEQLPNRAPRKERPVRHGVAFWITAPDGAVLLRHRPESGLLGGMVEIPSTEWRTSVWTDREARRAAPVEADWEPVPGEVNHVFTHFRLEMTVLKGAVRDTAGIEGFWSPPERLDDWALPTAMKKIVQLVAADRPAPRR